MNYLARLVGTDLKRLHDRARSLVTARLQERARGKEIDFPALNLGDVDLEKAKHLLEKLAAILAVTPNELRADDLLGDILTVTESEFPELPTGSFEKAGAGSTITVFALDVLAMLEKESAPNGWIELRNKGVQLPNSEDEWVDFVLEMKLRQFLTTFAPAMLVPRAATA